MLIIREGSSTFPCNDLGGGSTSETIFDPAEDSRIPKTNRFRPKKGAKWPERSYDQDEMVLVTQGHISLTVAGKRFEVRAGDYYFIRAGTPFILHALEDSECHCIFLPPPTT